MFSIILDSIVIVLLIATVTYCWRLTRRIKDLHESRGDLAKFIDDFNLAIESAEHNISELKAQGQIADDNLKELINKAQFLSNDLTFLVDKGESIADALEQYISMSRPMINSSPAMPRKSKAASGQKRHNPSNEKKVSPSQKKQSSGSGVEGSGMSPSKRQMLDDLLKQISERKEKRVNQDAAVGAEALATRKVKRPKSEG